MFYFFHIFFHISSMSQGVLRLDSTPIMKIYWFKARTEHLKPNCLINFVMFVAGTACFMINSVKNFVCLFLAAYFMINCLNNLVFLFQARFEFQPWRTTLRVGRMGREQRTPGVAAHQTPLWIRYFKGTVSRDFLLPVFLMNQLRHKT
jgi:hypothetical protein